MLKAHVQDRKVITKEGRVPKIMRAKPRRQPSVTKKADAALTDAAMSLH